MTNPVVASIHQRLLNKARQNRRPFNEILQYYAIERFLYRLSQSDHAGQFVLKGALLFRVWNDEDSRATRDIDFLSYSDNSVDSISEIVKEVIEQSVPDDGISFDVNSVEASRILEEADYEGVRLKFNGLLGNARFRMQLDIGFGDVVYPAAYIAEYPALLDHPPPRLRVYPRETVIAEKLEAMLHLGALNSRLKDFYDIWVLSKQSFNGSDLQTAIENTLLNRGTEIFAFSELKNELLDSQDKQAQWTAFIQKTMVVAPEEFAAVLNDIGDFLAPAIEAIRNQETFDLVWEAGGPWRENKPHEPASI